MPHRQRFLGPTTRTTRTLVLQTLIQGAQYLTTIEAIFLHLQKKTTSGGPATYLSDQGFSPAGIMDTVTKYSEIFNEKATLS
jgi:hypothetical protein